MRCRISPRPRRPAARTRCSRCVPIPTHTSNTPFAPRGERSIARGYTKAVKRAKRLIYLEDQYLWSKQVADLFAAALRDNPDLHLIAVVPRHPDVDGRLSLPPNQVGRWQAIQACRSASPERVLVYDVENHDGTPVYVHAKVCVIDDVWACVGSDNFNRRSWTHDSELSCAVLDDTRDERAPRDPAGRGDGARVFARDLRLRLLREHLDRAADGSQDDGLIDVGTAVEAVRATALGARRLVPPGTQRAPTARPPAATRTGAAEQIDPILGRTRVPDVLRPRRAFLPRSDPRSVVTRSRDAVASLGTTGAVLQPQLEFADAQVVLR